MSDKNIACKDMILELQDMTYLDWAAEKTMSGTPGCFVKIYEEAKGKRVYYKLSNYDCERGIFGRECVNELIASRLMNVLGIPHADYKLIHAKVRIGGKEQETWLSVSEDFLMPNQEKMPYEDYYRRKRNSAGICHKKRMGTIYISNVLHRLLDCKQRPSWRKSGSDMEQRG